MDDWKEFVSGLRREDYLAPQQSWHEFDQAMEQRDEEDPKVLELRLQRFPNAQIAERMECCERTVRRGLNRVQKTLKSEMATLMRQRSCCFEASSLRYLSHHSTFASATFSAQ